MKKPTLPLFGNHFKPDNISGFIPFMRKVRDALDVVTARTNEQEAEIAELRAMVKSLMPPEREDGAHRVGNSPHYEVVVGGVVLDKVKGKAAATARYDELKDDADIPGTA